MLRDQADRQKVMVVLLVGWGVQMRQQMGKEKRDESKERDKTKEGKGERKD